ncbi:MAG TPA: acyl-CoA dehydrogenase family protein [Bryobacteraceae bacterium]|nr:acyl-CoA dehydrogenase family protein [Bryobacteraceae bacterium]
MSYILPALQILNYSGGWQAARLSLNGTTDDRRMNMTTDCALDWKQTLAELGPAFAERAAAYDSSDGFIAENYAEMRQAKLFSALVPEELGGGGLSYSEMCALIRGLGRCCGSTALTFSMHQHLLAAALWNYRHGKPGEKLLRAVAGGQKILVSTGATDWLTSNGTLERCESGYRFSARKVFASGCLAGDLLITSGQYDDPAAGRQVLHFPVSLAAEGVRIDRVWETMGMRGTGSHTVILDHVFIPEETIALRRPCGKYHPVWNVILTVALPLICAAYVGVAEAAAEKARAGAARKGDGGVTAILIGEMENELATAQIALESMIANVNDLDVEPGIEHANRSLIRKTIVTEAITRTAEKALEATGGSGYFRASGLERILRDAHAAQFHPMQPKKQQLFTGRFVLGLDPAAS